MNQKRVYLSGPIMGLTYRGCNSWREYAIKELDKLGIVGVSPLRCKMYLDNGGILGDSDQLPLTCDRGIVTRDRWDVTQNCEVMLTNLLGAERVSIGTMFEYAWADMAKKPIVTIMEKQGNVHDHIMVRETTGFRVETLEEGLEIVRAILLP